MGGGAGAHTQSQYVAWTGPAGPQSCGLWVGSLAQPAQERFTDENRTFYNAHSTRPLTPEAAFDSQRKCNVCHVGCLDCHAEPLAPDPANPAAGAHRIVRKPPPLSCYGGGKSLSCHAGPGERRRGDGFIRGEFTQASAAGKKQLQERPDVHYAKKMACVDCHRRNPATSDHADLQRTVDCGRCHEEEVAAHRQGPHRTVDCAACHVALIGGYAFNFWTYREEDEVPSPLTRIQDYYTDAVPPLLVRNPQGIWIPVHVIPHTSGNVKANEVQLSKKLLFRNRPDVQIQRRYVSNDAFAVTGLAKNVDPFDRDVLVWLEVERVAHGLGKARGCAACHASREQRIVVKFETSGDGYQDVGNGEYMIVANRQGLRVTGFRGPDGGPPARGLAPFLDKWTLAGDFSLPPVQNAARYRKLQDEYGQGRFRH
jgi:hypothetical protein